MQNEKEKRQTCKQLKEKLTEWQEEYEFMQEQLKQLLVEQRQFMAYCRSYK